jgi:hypothetical protein
MINKNSIAGGIGLRSMLVTLLVAFCLAGLYFAFVRLNTIVTKSPQQVRLYYKKVYRFSEQEKADFINKHAGLWQFNIETMENGKIVKKTDRLEIKQNGIVWQVTEWDIPMPSDTVVPFRQIRTAFIKPYGVMKNDSMCDAFILTQAFTDRTDTCFGAWNYPELWSFQRDGASLIFNQRRYASYNGEPGDFFPRGSIAYVQSAENQFFKDTVMGTSINQLYSVRKVDSATGAVKLVPIRDSISSLSDLFRTAINGEDKNNAGGPVDKDAINTLLVNYFDPFIISEKMRNFPRELPAEINASFVVKPDGGVDSISLTSSVALDKMLSEDLVKEIGSWRFPGPGVPTKIIHVFKMPVNK